MHVTFGCCEILNSPTLFILCRLSQGTITPNSSGSNACYCMLLITCSTPPPSTSNDSGALANFINRSLLCGQQL